MAESGRLVDAFLGGWTATGIATIYRSGFPRNIGYTGDTMNVGVTANRANRLKDGRIEGTPDAWFDLTAFGPPASGTWGNAGTGILSGVPSRGADARLYKSFRIIENVNLQLRSEFYNVFNYPIWNNPATTMNALNFGKLVSKSLSPRSIQFALRLTF
jgi:hypothetical protein